MKKFVGNAMVEHLNKNLKTIKKEYAKNRKLEEATKLKTMVNLFGKPKERTK